MFFNADDDDDFSSSFGAATGGKSNLSSLFGADQAAFNSSKNESLTYTAPKQPKKQAASSGQETLPAVLHAIAVQAFKFVNGQYASQGKLGVAVLGNHGKKEYRLLLYAGKKKQVTSAKITSSFSFVVQANNYSSFYDDARQSWSLRFDSQQNVSDFAKQVGLARYNSAPGGLVKQDLQPGDGQAIENGDIIEVKYTGSLWTNNAFGKVFDSNAAADKLFKLRPGKGKVIKGWEEGVVGMKKGGKRLLAIPPELAYGDKGVPSRVPPKSTLLFEVEISRVKFSKENVSSDTSTPPPVHEHNQKDDINTSTSSQHSREDDDVRERTASLNKELSLSPEKGSEKAKLLARMSKMGKNVLKIPGAVAAEPDEDEHEPAESVEHIAGRTSARTQAEPVPERPRAHSHDYHDPSGNPHPHSPGKPPIAPRSAHVNKVAHTTPAHAPSHVTQPQAPAHYHAEYQNPPPTQTHIPPQQQTLALYQTPLQQPPPVYQQPAQYAFPQPQPPFPPVYQQPAPQPIFQPAPAVQPSPTPSSSGGTSDVMMPMLMTESRQHQTEVRQAITKVSEKIDSLEHKLDLLKQSNGENSAGAIRPAVPGLSDENLLEASVLMNSIVKLVQENERMKRENVEKTAKVEALNEKISELLHRSQRYVEQSNIFLEQRNESLQQSSSYSQSKLVQLEKEKATLSTELGTYKQNFATMETELEILRKQDSENRELLKKNSSQLQKCTSELDSTKESLTEREDELVKSTSSLKNLKQERKKLEGNLTSLEETVSDLKQEKESLEKNLADRKKKHAVVKKRMDEEIEELKSGHEEELNSLKERHRRELTSSSSSLSHQISQLETEVETKWQEKSKQMVNQSEKKWQRKYDDVIEECDALKKKISESEEKYSTMKTSQNEHVQKIDDLQEKLKDLEETHNKYSSLKSSQSEQQQEMEQLREKAREMESTQKRYQDLRTRSIEMKEKYEERLQEMAKEKEIAQKEAEKKLSHQKEEASVQQQAAEPSRDKIVNEVKQIMNKVFFKIREEFVNDDSYQGSAIIAVVLNVIKTMTLKMTSGAGDEESEEEEEEDEIGEESEKEEEEENEEEEEEESEQEDGDASAKEKDVEIESGNVKQDESEEEESGGEESGNEESGDEESGESQSEKVDESEEVEGKNEMTKQGEVQEDEMNDQQEIEKHETKETQGSNEVDENEQTDRTEEKIGEDGDDDKESEGDTLMDTDAKEEVLEEAVDIPRISENTIESPLHRANHSDSEDDDEDLGSRGISEVPPVTNEGEPEDSLDHLEVTRRLGDTPSSEEDLENISNRSIHGSEQDAHISSDDEDGGKSEDNDEPQGDEQGPLMSDLPTMDELTGTTKDTEDTNEGSGNQGESMGVEVEKSEKGEEKNGEEENGEEKTAKSEATVDVASEEKTTEEKKAQSLSDFLSDDEDDVEGLFDAPAPKTPSTQGTKEEGPPLKAIPPPLFDDDDDDDLDWFN